jgi:hypothetical protein
MIIGRASDGKTQMLLLGVSRENVNRLIKGQPILVKRETHGDGIPRGWQITIVFGETEEDIANDLRRAGMVSKDTKIYKDPRL